MVVRANRPVKLFYSYCHRDASLRDELETHLAILKREGYIESWYDHMILPGKNIDEEIERKIIEAEIILLMVSPDFIASDYCYSQELSRALERHEDQQATVIPIIVRPVKWAIAPFSKLKALPKDGEPVTIWANRDEAWLNVVDNIEKVIEHIWYRKKERATAGSGNNRFADIKKLLSQAVDMIDEKYNSDEKYGGLATFFDSVDLIVDGLHKGGLYIVASRPEMGRADFVLSIAEAFSLKHRVKTAYISTTYTSQQITQRIIASLGIIEGRSVASGSLSDSDWPRLTSAIAMSVEAPIFIMSNDTFNMGEIISELESLNCEGGLGLIVIDNLQHLKDSGSPESVARELKSIARKYDVPVIATSRVYVRNNRVDKRPFLEDLGEWQCLEEYADVIMTLYRDEVYCEDSMDKGFVEVIVRKNNFGGLGMARLVYFEKYHKFENFTPEMLDKK